METTQQRLTTAHARSTICARPNRGPPKASSSHVPAFRGCRRSLNGLCTRRSGTAGHAFHQAMILSTGDDQLLCKVFTTSLKGPALAWFHKLPSGSINTFSELWAAFVSQYLCSVRQKGNISSLQSILKREEESIWDFTRRFGQAVQQIDIYSMDAVLQNFKRSFGSTTPFFQSLSLDPLVTMEELYCRADKFSTLEDNIRAASQTVMITAQNNKPATKGPSE